MSEFKVDFTDAKFKDEVATPENLGIRQWAAIIKYADKFLGCDSLGQHLAYSMDTPSVVVVGSTYPINVSYPNDKNVDILDMGELDREYSPIRVTQDERIDRKNEPLMTMTKEIVELVIEHVTGKTK
jgi:ADP-heptose:LPS heptosyltransferase